MAKFNKGNKAGKKISGEIAADMQKKSVVSRLANKRGAELIRAMLAESVKDPVVLEAMKKAGYQPEEVNNEIALHARQIEKAQKMGDTRAYSALMKAAGYDTINVKTDGPAIVPMTPDAIEALSKWAAKE